MKISIALVTAAAAILLAVPTSAHVPADCLRHNAIMESFLASKKSMATQFETAPHGGIRDQIKEAQEGGWERPNIDPKTGYDRRGMALSALDSFTYSYMELDLRHMDAFADYLLCIAR